MGHLERELAVLDCELAELEGRVAEARVERDAARAALLAASHKVPRLEAMRQSSPRVGEGRSLFLCNLVDLAVLREEEDALVGELFK